jgi:uncharacterized protein (DUF58 family)
MRIGNWLRCGGLLLCTAAVWWWALDRGGRTAWFGVYAFSFLWVYAALVAWYWRGLMSVEPIPGTGTCLRGERLEVGFLVRLAGRPLPGTWIGLEASWLSATGESFVLRHALSAGGRRELTFRGRMQAPDRGLYTPDEVIVRVGDAFGLLRFERRLEGAGPLYVLPRPWEAAAATLGGFGEGRVRESRPMDVPQVSGTRPYAPGDPLRRIHWRSTARTGELRAKETEQPAAGRLLVVLDAAGAGVSPSGAAPLTGADPGLEAVVEAAAGLAKRALELGLAVRLAVSDGQGRVWEAQGAARLPELLQLLATVPCGADRPVAELLLREAQQSAASGAVTLVTARADAQLPALLRRLPRGAAQVLYVHGPGAVSGVVHAWRRQLETLGCRVGLMTTPLSSSKGGGADGQAVAGA